VQFRDEILRGVRLFLIAFAAILIVVWAYRMVKTPSDTQGAAQQESPGVPAAPEAAQPAQETPTPVADASSELHGLVVPPPPPVAGTPHVSETHARKAARLKDSVPPPPPPVAARARRAPAPREFEASEPGVLPAAPSQETADSTAPVPQKGVGYKSLLDADPNRAAVEPVGQAPPQEQAAEKPKGNRFFRAVGKIFRPGAKKEPVPLTLQQPKQ